MMDRDELLTIRLQELKEDISLVVKVLNRATSRGDDLNIIGKLVKTGGDDTIGESLLSAQRNLRYLADDLGDATENLTELVEKMHADLNRLSARLSTAALAATAVNERMQALDTFVDREFQNIDNNLNYSRDMIYNIDDLIEELHTTTDREIAWNKFDKLIDECQPLFADYVDFLSGVTLRDYRLDDGVAFQADRVFEALAVQRIAMPGRQGHLPTKLSSLAKFQFPEWTVWDVPLAGYHAGLFRCDIEDPIIKRFRQLHEPTFPTDVFAQQLFAEVYASCFVGLAYGYAALLLHLHPRNTARTAENPSAADRAHVILETLDYFGKTDPTYSGYVHKLREWWEVAAAGVTTVSANDAEVLTKFVTEVLEQRLADRMRPEPYTPDRWHNATKDVATKQDFQAPRQPEVLDQLNAAWHLRITQPDSVADFTADDLNEGTRYGQPASDPSLRRQTDVRR
jgi:hypothetical protein